MNNNKILIIVAVVFSVIYLLDFIFSGMQLKNLATASGWALLAYGTYKDQNAASLLGGGLVIGGLVIKYFP